MALTWTLSDNFVVGNKRMIWGTVALDTSYTTGGYAITAANLGLSSLTSFIPIYPGATFVKSSAKLQMFQSVVAHSHNLVTANSAGGTALTGAANALNANIASFTITGGGASGIQNNTAVNLQTEIAATTDLSSVTALPFIALGT